MSPPYDAVQASLDLAAADPSLADVIAQVGPPTLTIRPVETADALVRSVVYQQLSGKAAGTIHGRVLDAFGTDGVLSLPAVLDAPDEALRACGLSRAKVASVKDIARRHLDGDLPTRVALLSLSDETVVASLLPVRGVGVWTVQMFLMSNLGRPDVWPTGDLGVQEGVRRIAGLEDRPTPREVDALGEAYRPWRSVAAWYAWRAVDLAKGV